MAADAAAATPLLDARDATALAIWVQHVAVRHPLLLDNVLATDEFHQLSRWTDQYLHDHVGANVRVKVEVRQSATASFGRGITQLMPFRQFLRRFAAGDSSMYMTAQDVKVAADGHPQLFAPPVTQLQADLPLQPACMGNLIPQQLNLWMGNSPDGASSGLHHDFHDNLYILLRGRKRFRVYPPDQAKRMYTHGRIAKVHANGRIVYANQDETNADGSGADEAAAWQERVAAEADIAAAQEAVQRGEKGAAARLTAAEARLDAALERALDLQLGAGDEDGDDDSVDGSGQVPHNFSQVDLSTMSDAQISSRLPRFPGRQAARVVGLHAGQALYLPAGWFHEVTSFSTKQQQGHMAFSYWFHPPDNLRPDASGLNQPYTSGFWPALWAARVPRVRPALCTQLNGTTSSPARVEEEHTAGAESAGGSTPAYLALPVYRLWWRHPSWIATCGRRRHQFLLMRRVRRRAS